MVIKKLSPADWVKSFELAPRVAVDVWVKRGRKVLLTKRGREPFVGWWHLPGSFLLKGETFGECVTRVAEEELGVGVERWRMAGTFENLRGDPRGHVIDVVFKVKLKGEPKAVGDTAEVKWFVKLPKKIGFNQKAVLS